MDELGFLEEDAHPHGGEVPFETLRRMSAVFPINSIIALRQNQVGEFSRPQKTSDKLGFFIQRKIGTTEESDPERDRIATLIESGGEGGRSFYEFLRCIVRDSLVYDAVCIEVLRNRGGDVIGFRPLDPSTIRKRPPETEEEEKLGVLAPDSVHYEQRVKRQTVAEFGKDDLCFGVRRPRTDLRYAGYGHPELSELVGPLTRLLQCESYNAQTFTSGVSANYIIAIKSKMAPNLFRTFRRDWIKMLSGANNRHRTPMIQLDPDGHEGIETHRLGENSKSMEFQEWWSTLLKQICAAFCTDPAELGFNFIGEGLDRALHSPGPGEKILVSKEKGLRPLLRSVENWMNQSIVQQINNEYELRFCGLDAVSPKEALDMDIQRLQFMSVDEVRRLRGLPPVEQEQEQE